MIKQESGNKTPSTTAMMAFEEEPDLPEVKALGERTWELTDFIVHGLGITEWPGQFNAKMTFHRS